jgi:phenylpyruvate tautomerase PptA (4-oxalocrotonate tautomerase family)
MPFYTCFAVAGSLPDTQKAFIAEEITRIHTTLTGAPPSFVRVLFQDMPPLGIFSGGKNQPFAMIRGVIRSGRSAETKTELLKQLWALLLEVTALTHDQLLVSVQDNPAGNAMEGGELLPEPHQEAEWLARHRGNKALHVVSLE